jgi:hypothetical protein
MTKAVVRVVRNAIREQMQQRLPWFQEAKAAEVPPGHVLYEWPVDTSLAFYVLLAPSKRFEEFTFEIGWSRKGTYPYCLPSLSVTDRPCPDEFRIELPLLWRSASEPTYWWSVIPKPSVYELARQLRNPPPIPAMDGAMEAKVKALATDAVEMLVTHGVPFFVDVASEHALHVNVPVTET